MKDNSSAQTSDTLWTKIDHQSEILGLLSGLVKIHKIPHIIFETTSQFFFETWHHSSVSREITFLYFF